MDKQRIAFIGLGVMGGGMASRLVESGYEVAVYNRTRSKAEEVGELGARVADSPADAAREADVVMLSLANQDVVSKLVFEQDGVLESFRQGGYLLDMSTVTPEFARELAGRLREAGYHALDTCVLGNPFHARQGELRVMAGGDEGDFKAVEPLLEGVGKEVTYLGESGMGATMKLVLNMLMGVQMPALAEAVVFGERAGLDRDKILEMISKSGYSSPVMSFRCAIMGQRNFELAAFKLGLMRKDMTLVLRESQKLSVPMPVSESAYAMLTAAEQQGLGDLDVASILAFQERMTGLEGYPWPGADGGTEGGEAAS
jgi:3-hydroxyisobutyrate dehydrogenase